MSEVKIEAEGKIQTVVDQLADFRKRVVKCEELTKSIAKAKAAGEPVEALEQELAKLTVTDEELKDSIERLRKLRDKTAPVAKAKATKAAVKTMDASKAQDLLGDLL